MFKRLRYWRDMRRFQTLSQTRRHLVFYCEGPTYWVHLEPLVRHLLSDYEIPVCYLSSSPDDPGLDVVAGRGEAFVIGDGAVRTVLFNSMPPGIVVMTMPDLESFHIKRSIHPVHYVYVQHSLVSTHMIYRPDAFDHFDTIFCAGPHHIAETRAREDLLGLPEKQLFEHGYGRLDSIMARAPEPRSDTAADGSEPLHVLLAPSWGPNGLLESRGAKVVDILLAAGFRLTVRPHPQTRLLTPAAIAEIKRRFSGHPLFRLEDGVVAADSLHAADVMISDWSGAAMEFAFCMDRPVLFIDVPRKVRNPDYEALGIEPLEARIRGEIGDILPPDRLAEAPEAIRRLAGNRRAMQQCIRDARARWVFNLHDSGAAGARRLAELYADFTAARSGP
jgi:hypothetical protein